MVDGGGCKMANPFHSTGSPIVDRMCRLQFTGNVIPAAWYRTITRDNGKPNLTAIIILSDVVYWYRPVEIRDELTGQLCGFKKKFKADILQRNYQQLADQFGISKREAVNAVVELEKIGVVKRVFRTVRKGEMRNSNVLFLELNVDVLIQLTYPENLSDAGYHFLKGELSPHKERGATSGCDRISQSNEAYLSFEGDTNTEITEENTDIEYPLCSYQAVERAIRIQISYDALKNDHPYDRRVEDDDDKIRLNQRKPSKYKGLRRFGPEKNLQRINKFMKERPIFYKNLIQMKENIRFYLRCFYCITKVMILQFNSENRTELARNG